jgi:Tfp pilus assembly protein PilO
MNAKSLSLLVKKYPFSAVCAVLALLFAILYYYRSTGIEDLNGVLSQKNTEARKLKTNIANSAQLKEQLELLQAANEKVVQRLMRESDLAANQQYFYKIESETGIKLTDLRPGGASSQTQARGTAVKPLYPPVPYTCAIQGNYTQILQFLRKLENGEHFVRILSANLGLAGGGASGESANTADPALTLVLSVEFLGKS